MRAGKGMGEKPGGGGEGGAGQKGVRVDFVKAGSVMVVCMYKDDDDKNQRRGEKNKRGLECFPHISPL